MNRVEGKLRVLVHSIKDLCIDIYVLILSYRIVDILHKGNMSSKQDTHGHFAKIVMVTIILCYEIIVCTGKFAGLDFLL